MEKLIFVLVIMGVLFSCTSKERADDINQISTNSADREAQVESDDLPNLLEIDTDEALIATALMAAPKASREGCKVIGFNMAGDFVTLKEGNNEFICLADDPGKSGFNAACYHKDLDPFMARGRELKVQGKSSSEIFDIREEEVKSGKLEMGKTGSTLHILYGSESDYNPVTNEVPGAIYRYVVYMPWATAESSGLPEIPIAPNHPWIMNPGTHRAHIMISPLEEEGE